MVIVCEPSSSVDVKEETGSECLSENESCSSIVQVYNSGPCGAKKWTAEALYESCRLKVRMSSSDLMSKSIGHYKSRNIS